MFVLDSYCKEQMEENNKAELVFIPSPGRGHLEATMEVAKLLINRDERFSITLLSIQPFSGPKTRTDAQNLSDSRIRVIDLPQADTHSTTPPVSFLEPYSRYIAAHKVHVRDAVAKLGESRGLAGFVIDMFCTSMIDVANEFGLPSYLFYTANAATLGLMFHFQSLRDDQNQDIGVYEGLDIELSIPTYKNPVPAKLLPEVLVDKNDGPVFLNHAKRFRETRGIMINSFVELEPLAMNYLSGNKTIPPVYSIGPMLHTKDVSDQNSEYGEIMRWLDNQPDSSVVFLCFGSNGCFNERQVKEIAFALEKCSSRFLWSLRKPPVGNKFGAPVEYEDFRQVLPEGFLERTSGFGKVIGWAPQVAVLGHPSVTGFVSHCGWNSALESIWCGVPMAAWPLYAEQQVNAFELVKDLRLAVEIKMDYSKNRDMIVMADEIEKGIKSLIDPHCEARANIEAMKVKSRMAITERGSSINSMENFIKNVIKNQSVI